MSYVWSQEQVDRYFGYYRDITDHHEFASVSYDTTEEFVRSVLPPCLEPAARPTVSVGVSAFMEFVGGAPNRPGRDRAALIGVNARHGGLEGTYYLTVVETEEVNIVTGRELWGMPKKQGQVDFFNDGDRLFGYVERRGHRLIELEATLGPDEGPGEPQTEIDLELRGHFGANGGGLTDP